MTQKIKTLKMQSMHAKRNLTTNSNKIGKRVKDELPYKRVMKSFEFEDFGDISE